MKFSRINNLCFLLNIGCRCVSIVENDEVRKCVVDDVKIDDDKYSTEKVKVLKQDSFDIITCHDIVLDEVCRPLAVHFVVTRDSIADLYDNCNCLAFLERVLSTNHFRTSRRNMTLGYKHATNMFMLTSEPLSMLHKNCFGMY